MTVQPEPMFESRDTIMSDLVNSRRLDRSAISVVPLGSLAADDRTYWAAMTPVERLAAMEWMRVVNYGYNPVTDRLQRVLTIAPLGAD